MDTTGTETGYTRRTVITASALGIAGLAGCVGGASTSGEDTATETEGTATHHEEEGNHDDEHTEEGSHGEEGNHDGEHTEGGSHEHGGIPDDPVSSATVEMLTEDGEFHFHPHVVWIEKGGSVTWELTSGSHTATAYENRIPSAAETWDSGMLSESGATFEHTFEKPGVYDYYCTPHKASGMLATVVVGKPDPHDQPGLAEPDASLSETERHKIEELNKRANEILSHSH